MKMTHLSQSLQDNFFTLLEKSSYFKKRELRALWALLTALIGSASFSLSKVSRLYGRKVGRNFLAKVLKKYTFVQRSIAHQLIKEILSRLGKKAKLYLIIDDTLVPKEGKNIFGAFRWYNHAQRRSMQALCLVNLALVIDGTVVFLIPWLLSTSKKATIYTNSGTKEQDLKNIAAMDLTQTFVEWFEEGHISKERILIEADSWYSTVVMRTFLDQLGVKYRIDGKCSYNVKQPDHDAIKKAKTQIRGRKRSRFIKYTRLDNYFGFFLEWRSFVDPDTNERVYYKSAQVNMKTGGQCVAYAFRNESWKYNKYILTKTKRKSRASARTVYRDYKYRWLIEVSHRELKQQFGLGKCQNRDAWVVHGFLGLIALVFSLWHFLVYCRTQSGIFSLKCPSWAQEFHKLQIIHRSAINSG